MSVIDITTSSFQHYSSSFSKPGGTNRIIVRRGLNQLYYTNFITGSGDVAENYVSDEFTSASSDIRLTAWDNYVESSFATSSRTLSSRGAVYSIPKDLYGTHIEPGSVVISGSGIYLVDDKEGNLRSGSLSGAKRGNVVYSHGQLIINNREIALEFESGSMSGLAPDIAPGSAIITFKGNLPIYTYNYNVKVSEHEYNHTLNPTAQSGSNQYSYSGSNYLRPSGILADNVTGSYFNPYISTVGLYNENKELIAVGKFAQPVPKPANTELTIQVKLDI